MSRVEGSVVRARVCEGIVRIRVRKCDVVRAHGSRDAGDSAQVSECVVVETHATEGATMEVYATQCAVRGAHVTPRGVMTRKCTTDGRKIRAVLNSVLGTMFKRSEAGGEFGQTVRHRQWEKGSAFTRCTESIMP